MNCIRPFLPETEEKSRRRFRSTAVFTILCAAALAGCGAERIPISGTVTYQDKPLEHGRVGFYPEQGRPAFGDIHDGHYTMMTLTPGDGVSAGKYRVIVQSDAPTKDPFDEPISLVPACYRALETTPLAAEIQPGGQTEFHFELND